jgi:LEA14-like dessication related protein
MITIFSLKGEQIMYGQFQNQNPVEMDVSMLAKGIYLVKIQTSEGVESKKLVIQ